MKLLNGTKVRIISDNESYFDYLDCNLVITQCYYEDGKDENPIYDLDIISSTEEFPFSLYEWEFEVI